MPNAILGYYLVETRSVDRNAEDVSRKGLGLWTNRHDLVVGQEWLRQIQQAISGSEFMIGSPASVPSRFDINMKKICRNSSRSKFGLTAFMI